MTIEYDENADALYISLAEKPYDHGNELDDRRRIDYASDGTAIGVELLFPTLGIDVDGLPLDGPTIAVLASQYRFVVHS